MSRVPGKGEFVYNAPLLIPGGEHVTANDSVWFTIPVKPCSITTEPMGTLLLVAIVTVRVFKRPTMGLDWAMTLVCKLGFTTQRGSEPSDTPCRSSLCNTNMVTAAMGEFIGVPDGKPTPELTLPEIEMGVYDR
jgi:hypothetical protein